MMRRTLSTTVLWLTLLLPCLLPLPATAAPKNNEIAIIVSAQENWHHLDGKANRRLIARIFRKQVTLDRYGQRLHPVNLSATHLLRQKFSRALFRKTPLKMASYWNERYFQGISPPHVVNSQEAMIRFVAATPGAIGYIAPCMADDRVRIILTIKVRGGLSKHLCH